MRESRKNLDKTDIKFSKTETKRPGKAKEGYKRRTGDGSRRKNAESVVSELDGSSSDMTSVRQSCNSPAKSEDSSESSDQSASSGNVGGSSSQSSIGSRGGQYASSANKKHGIAGIKFQPGLRLEAKDLGNDIWYAVKVVEVDWEEEEILIHFEKWSQRYDEWIPMDSSRLRPIQEPPGGLKKSSKIFKVGDKVMATWSDSRKYPAKVKTVIGNDRYEVLFFDGFSKNIKGGRMTLLKDEELASIEQLKPGIGPSNDFSRSPPPIAPLLPEKPSPSDAIGTKEERRERKRKLNVAELFHFKKRPKLDSSASKCNSAMEGGMRGRRGGGGFSRGGRRPRWTEAGPEISSPSPGVKTEASLSPSVEVKKEPKEEVDMNVNEEAKKVDNIVKPKRRISYKMGDDEKPSRRFKTDESSQKSEDGKGLYAKKFNRNFSRKSPDDEGTKKEKGQDVEISRSKKDGEPSKSRPFDDWEPEGQPAYIFGGPRKSIIVADPRIPAGWTRHTIQRMSGHSAGKWDVFFVSPQGRKFRTRHELRMYYEDMGEPFPTEQFDFSLGRRRKAAAGSDKADSGRSATPGRMGRNVGSSAGSRPRTPFGPGGGVNSGVGGVEAAAVVGETPVRRVKTLLPRVRQGGGSGAGSGGGAGMPDGGSVPSPPPPHTPGTGAASPAVAPDATVVPASPSAATPTDGALVMGGLRIQRENDAYKCPKEGCNKNFRKENLLQMHLKHYHPEYNRFVASTPNVADLAYARTVGEPIDELMPHTRFEMASVALARRGSSSRGGVMSGTGSNTVVESDGPAAPSVPALIHVHSHMHHPSASPTHPSRRSTPAARKIKIESDGCGETIGEDCVEVGEAAAKPTIKTLLPVVRPVVVGSEAMREDQKNDPVAAVAADVVDVGQNGDADAGPPPLTPALTPTPGPSGIVGVVSSQPVGQTKSLRTVRRRCMSDFHMEPLLKKRKTVKMPELVPEDVDVGADESSGAAAGGTKVSATYRFSRKKMPVVHLEKLQVTTDSNEVEEQTPNPQPTELSTRPSRVETLRREELINCTCGYPEEDGLMIQCDLCLCWQHGLCNNIDREEDVPEKYVCFICLHPSRERRSKRFLHDQDWLKEGTLPSLPFRSKNNLHVVQREAILKRSHELTGTLLQLRNVVHSLRVKVNIAEKLDHPKLYLWACSWEKGVQDGQKSSVKVKQEPGAGGNGACQTFLPAVPRGALDFPPPASATEQVPCDPVNDTESTEADEKPDVVTDDGDTKDTITSQETVQKMGQESAEPQKEVESAEERGPRAMNESRETTQESDVQELHQARGIATNGDEGKAMCVEDTCNPRSENGNKQSLSSEGEKGGTSMGTVSEEKELEPELQLPICQSELMDLATSMASSMASSTAPKAETESQRAETSQTSPPVPPRAPQPEAPIDPMECRLTLLDHIEHFHQQVDSRLTSLETQIAALESMDPYLVHDEASDPRTKETVQMLLRDLATLRDVAAFN